MADHSQFHQEFSRYPYLLLQFIEDNTDNCYRLNEFLFLIHKSLMYHYRRRLNFL